MAHARIGIYTLTGDGIKARNATDGMKSVFKEKPGFVDFSVIAAGEKMISISTWETREQAETASAHAATYVEQHLSSEVNLDMNYIGEVVASSN